MIIREEQFKKLEINIDEAWKREFANRLRKDKPDLTSQLSNEQLAKEIDKNYQNATELEIAEKEDIYRFIKLAFLPKEMIESEFIQSVIIRVLNNLNLSGTKRLDFLEKQLTERQLS